MNNLLFKILKTQSTTYKTHRMQRLIRSEIPNTTKDKYGNIYAVHDPLLPFVVCHIDTVHAIQNGELTPIQIGRNVTGINAHTMRQSGIGGDDKCGIYAAITLYKEGIANAAFFLDEEYGCLGSYAADMSIFEHTPYCLQADRKGNADLVTDICGGMVSKAFKKALKPIIANYGYSFTFGGMTDVMALRDNGIGVSCVNMSAGYYNPHSDSEYIDLDDLDNCVEMMRDILVTLGVRPYKFSPNTPSFKSWSKYKSWDKWESTSNADTDRTPIELLDSTERHREIERLEKIGVHAMTDAQYYRYWELIDS